MCIDRWMNYIDAWLGATGIKYDGSFPVLLQGRCLFVQCERLGCDVCCKYSNTGHRSNGESQEESLLATAFLITRPSYHPAADGLEYLFSDTFTMNPKVCNEVHKSFIRSDRLECGCVSLAQCVGFRKGDLHQALFAPACEVLT
jgi:hypothetical protein